MDVDHRVFAYHGFLATAHDVSGKLGYPGLDRTGLLSLLLFVTDTKIQEGGRSPFGLLLLLPVPCYQLLMSTSNFDSFGVREAPSGCLPTPKEIKI